MGRYWLEATIWWSSSANQGAIIQNTRKSHYIRKYFHEQLHKSCYNTVILGGSNIIGGVGPYEFGTTYFLSEAAALANTSWVAFTSISYGVGTADGTYWFVVKDSVGTLKAKSITTECNTTTTTTTSTSTSTTTTTSTSTSTTTTTTTVITDYYYYDLQSCTTSETSPGYSIYSGLSGVFVIGPADCYSIVSQVGSGTLPSGVDLDVLTNVISCSDPLCVS